jgi:lipopolysaccharide export system protein LptA
MVCKFRADYLPPMPPLRDPRLCLLPLAFGLVVAAGVPRPALAERADRSKPMVVEADKPGTVDLLRQLVVFNGNVVIAQGTMLIRAERVELRELPDGFRAASAYGAAGRPASFKQKRDGVDETVEGSAERIEYDGRASTLRLVGNGSVRRLRGTAVADEITGALIVWDNSAELFSVQGGASSAANPGGRVRAVLSPRAEAAVQPGASAASAPAPAEAGTGAALQPNRTLAAPR